MRYQLDQSQFNKFRKTLFIRLVPVLLVLEAWIFVINHDQVWIAVTTSVLLFLVFLVVWLGAIKKQRQAWASFELILHADSIERVQEGFPKLLLLKEEVKSVKEAKNGSITLVAYPRHKSITIPFAVENKPELMQSISSWTSVDQPKGDFSFGLSLLGSVLGLCLLYSTMVSTNFYYTVTSSFALISILLWGFVEIRRNPNFHKNVRQASYAGFIVIAVLIYKLMLTLAEV